ncbi:MAG: MBL fold metallo-hydrolase [Solirubrobacteraceae bacterium]
MRVLAVHEDVVVVISAVWQTTCTLVRRGDEGFMIDSPLLPEELEALPTLADQAGFPVSGLLATHGDWDHLLGRLAFPDHALGVGAATALRLAESIGEPQRRLREFDSDWYLEGRPPLVVADHQALPTPGRISIGTGLDGGSGAVDVPGAAGASEAVDVPGAAGASGAGREPGAAGGAPTPSEVEVLAAGGHTGDGVAYWIPWASVLVCGDYLSPVEIPMVSGESGGSFSAYLETLERFEPLLKLAEAVVPGHGAPLSRDRALEIFGEDLAYVRAGSEGQQMEMPPSRRTSAQKRVHAANLVVIAAGR